MLNLIYGPSGSGKTHRIINEIKEKIADGKNVLLIVPEQQMLSSERKMLSELPPSAQLNFSVLSFSRLANMVFRKYGGLSYNYITSAAKALIAWMAIKEAAPALLEFGVDSASDSALPAMFLSIISELKSNSITSVNISEVALRLPRNSQLRHKLLDISMIYELYENLLSIEYDDSEDDLTKAFEILKDKDFFNNTYVYFDSFTGFTNPEYEIIKIIIKSADDVTFALCTDGKQSKQPQFASINDAIFNLKQICSDTVGISKMREILLHNIKRTDSKELICINENLWKYEIISENINVPDDNSRGDVEMYVCSNPYSEAEMIANYITRMIINGMRYRDIAVITRNIDDRRGIIDMVLEKCNIPFYMSDSTDITTKPFVKLILSAVRIYNYHYRTDDVIAFVKTGLCGFSPIEIDIFEDYCTTWNICGSGYNKKWIMNPDGYKKDFNQRALRILDTANSVRDRLMTFLLPFCTEMKKAKKASDFCNAVYVLMKSLNITEELDKLAIKEASLGLSKEADETLQLYNTVFKIITDIDNIIGNMSININEFINVLKIVFAATEIDTIPTSADQVVVGSADKLRLNDVKCVFVCGLSDGEFPQNINNTTLLTTYDRKILTENGLNIYKNTDVMASEELYYVYSAFTRPESKLILSFPEHNTSNSPCNPSSALERIRFLLPYIKLNNYDNLPPDKKYYNVQSAFEHLRKYESTNSGKAMQSAIMTIDKYKNAAQYLYKHISEPDIILSPSTVSKIFGKKIRMTNTKLESYKRCRLSYYCSTVLKLRGHCKAEFKSNDIGVFIHYILENIMIYFKNKSLFSDSGAFTLSEEETDNIIDLIIEYYISENYSEQVNSSNRMKHITVKLKRLARLLIYSIIDELNGEEFQPGFFELKIDGRNTDTPEPLNITLKSGVTVLIGGTADRVDVLRKNNNIYIKVIDYKTGGKEFSLSDIEKGQNIQALLYLFAICRCKTSGWHNVLETKDKEKIVPSGAVYLSSNIELLKTDRQIEEKQALELASKKISRKGIYLDDPVVLAAINNSIKNNISNGKNRSLIMISENDFDKLYKDIEFIITALSEDMLTGNASARPALGLKDEYPDQKLCSYCKMSSICRISRKQKKDGGK